MQVPATAFLHAFATFLLLLESLVPLRAPFAGSVLSAPGDLDPSFGNGGLLTTQFDNGDSYGNAIALQVDGKIVVTGEVHNGNDYDFALARYNIDGSLDNRFGRGGKVSTDFSGGDDEGRDIVIQPADGKIVVAGYAHNGKDIFFAMARYNNDGSLDTGFGNEGKVTTDFGGRFNFCETVALQIDGKIVVAGGALNGEYEDFALARYNSDGSLDTSFGNDGKVITSFSIINDRGTAIAIQPIDGKIIIAGYSKTPNMGDYALARYNSNGSLDSSFSDDGIVTTDLSYGGTDEALAIALQEDGKIVLAGYSLDFTDSKFDTDFALARYNSDGNLDTSFGIDGKVVTDFNNSSDEVGLAIALQADGKIIVAGYTAQYPNNFYRDFALACYNSNGSLDTSFSDDGIVTTDFGDRDGGYDVAVQPNDGKIIIAGYTGYEFAYRGVFALARYEAPKIDFTYPPTPTKDITFSSITTATPTDILTATTRSPLTTVIKPSSTPNASKNPIPNVRCFLIPSLTLVGLFSVRTYYLKKVIIRTPTPAHSATNTRRADDSGLSLRDATRCI